MSRLNYARPKVTPIGIYNDHTARLRESGKFILKSFIIVIIVLGTFPLEGIHS